MKRLLLISVFLFSSVPVSAQEFYKINVNRLCASIVGIPYASDNFTDEKWEQFKQCVSFVKQHQN